MNLTPPPLNILDRGAGYRYGERTTEAQDADNDAQIFSSCTKSQGQSCRFAGQQAE